MAVNKKQAIDNMKTINFINFICLVCIIILSDCRKFDNTGEKKVDKPEPESLLSYYKFINHDRKGNFLFEASGGFWSQKDNVQQTMLGYFLDENEKKVNGGILKFGNHVLNPSRMNLYCLGGCYEDGTTTFDTHAAKDLFGTDMAIRLEIPTINGTARLEGTTKVLVDTLYVPKEIEYLGPKPTETDSSNILKDGFRIKWNEDERNMKGVVILIEYNPNEVPNQISGHKKTNPVKATKTITTKDVADGYVIKNSDLTNFSNNCTVTLRIGRANYITLKNNNDNYDVMALTYCRGFWRVKVKK